MSLIHNLIARNRAGEPIGLPCFCTANEYVLKAILSYAARTGVPTVIEATCNQVNQDGGYTGMTPRAFMDWLMEMADAAGVPRDQIIVGGDHLGPNPWRKEPLDQAMTKARELVRLYVEAGFTKIHLDASMACGGEPPPSFEQIADRAADLCAVAEAHAPDPSQLVYIIGTEVPIPGGETEEPDALDVTSVDRFTATIDTHRAAWTARGLDAAWDRIVSVVTQPGVDFGHTQVYSFAPEKARPLSDAIGAHDGLTLEAHSTDYQSTEALSQLVAQHFFFLKVGPELTFRFREAVWALADIAARLPRYNGPDIRTVVAKRMTEEPGNWQAYYSGSPADVEILKIFSYSDRIRYYWVDPKVDAALNAMLKELSTSPLPEALVSQAFMGLEFGEIATSPKDLIQKHVERCVSRYGSVTNFSAGA
ncbi:class II D-tagatose-bisphosphate aldolase, non-catalytic subunit [Roseibium sediminis]|uniref:class II D-tagatose-bisphosphate aldolase, non-catalytic subunit n=1 Tax=Roseibium sediminis TaxID=1775174 RepID=UPI00123DED95|nr:class II D-tagatose-bisphosphate aldolase, non-catalytic subunit [Roseibium sediminis]